MYYYHKIKDYKGIKMGVLIIFLVVLFRIMLWICHDWLGLSILTTIFFTLSLLSIPIIYLEIKDTKKAKEWLRKAKTYKARVVSKEVIHGYRGRTTYTFELTVENETIQISKDNIHKDLELNQTLDVYLAYDEQKNIADFEFAEYVKMNSKIYKPFIFFGMGSFLTSILFVLIDKASFMTTMSNIIGLSFFMILFLSTGIFSIRRAMISKKVLTPVEAIIHEVRIVTSYHFHHDIVTPPVTHISPIYRVEVNGQMYQFLGDKYIEEEDKGKKEMVYYDKETMEFFDLPKSKGDWIVGITLIILSILIGNSILQEIK